MGTFDCYTSMCPKCYKQVKLGDLCQCGFYTIDVGPRGRESPPQPEGEIVKGDKSATEGTKPTIVARTTKFVAEFFVLLLALLVLALPVALIALLVDFLVRYHW